MNDDDDNFDDDDDFVSKSQVKRECEALRKLGDELLQLKAAELAQIDLPEDLAAAINEGRKLQARGALKRQRQYIGKLMRNADSDSIVKQLAVIRHQHDVNTAHFKQAEQWRDRLLNNDREVITELVERFPDIDRQQLNQLVRQGKKEQVENKPPAAARKLFKYLMATITGS